MQIEIRVAGIPGIARTTCASYTKPNRSADSDWDFYGGWELCWEICDRRGRPAPWLERKASKSDLDEIEGQLIDAMTGADDDDDYF